MLFHASQHQLIIAEAVTDLVMGCITFLEWNMLGVASAEACAQELCDRTQMALLRTQDSNPDGSHPIQQFFTVLALLARLKSYNLAHLD